MYIISKKSEKDYYDGVAGTVGIDKTIVYDRQIIEVEEGKYPKIFERRKYLYTRDNESPIYKLHNYRPKKKFRTEIPHSAYFVVGFCGKLYPGFKLYRLGEQQSFGEFEVNTEYLYNQDRMIELFEPWFWGSPIVDGLKYVKDYDPIELFRELNTPCFVYDADYKRTYLDPQRHITDKSKFFINPLLKEYEFYKIFDSFQAFQEIQMFLGGVLGNREKDIVEVADKYKIAQHGFDKWSFRKPPENK